MNRFALLSTGFAACLAVLLPSAYAQADILGSATYVASTGSDDNASNACPPLKPCQTFAAALAVTDPGATIICLDTIIDERLTITRDVTIDCSHTSSAILALGAAAITINSGVKVTLRGLTLYASFDFFGQYGVLVTQPATVKVQNCKIFGMQQGAVGSGISVQAGGQVTIEDTVIEQNRGYGIELRPASGDLRVKIHNSSITGNAGGVLIKPGSGATVEAAIERSHIDNNGGAGVRADGTGGGTSTVSVAESSSSLNAGNGVLALSGPGNAMVDVTRTLIASNVSSGVQSNQTMGGSALLTVRGSTLTNNASGNVNFFGGGKLLTFGDNNSVGAIGTGFSGPISQF